SLEALIARAMCPDKEARFASVHEMRAALEAVPFDAEEPPEEWADVSQPWMLDKSSGVLRKGDMRPMEVEPTQAMAPQPMPSASMPTPLTNPRPPVEVPPPVVAKDGSIVPLLAVAALLGGLLAARFFTSRGAALVVMTVALAGLTRVVTMAVAAYGAGPASYAAVDPAGGSPVLVVVARSTATLSSALEAAALGIAAFWLVTQPRAVAGRLVAPRRPRWLLGLTVLGVVGLASFGLTFGHDPEARGVPLLVARAVEQLLHNPEPYTPAVVRRSLELLRWVLAVALLVAAPRGRMMASVVVLALVATGTLEVPLCAAAIVIAVLALGIHPGPRLFTPEAMEEGGAPTA
ncbi:MAG: hypothetical protein KC731_05805, partial [Myxococcales bacterium]|nr:hypothetical protein [Myxococcales bacterium]